MCPTFDISLGQVAPWQTILRVSAYESVSCVVKNPARSEVCDGVRPNLLSIIEHLRATKR
jgi:hypothetical protein